MAEGDRKDTFERRDQLACGGSRQQLDAAGQGVESRDHGASDRGQRCAPAAGAARVTDDERSGGGGVHRLDPVPSGAVGDADVAGGDADRPGRVDGPQQCSAAGTDVGAVRPTHPGLHPHLDGAASAASLPPGSGSGRSLVLPHCADVTSPASPVVGVYHRSPDPVSARQGRARRSARFWAHATAFGAAWGAIEITLGSFLHSLRLPFGGVVLASVGVGLLAAQRQFVPDRGASVATAAVAALCKSVSPGGVILGPMLAILIEGALVEVAVLAAPRALATTILAGSLCALWSVFQKLATQILLYGTGVVDLYLSALASAGRALGVPPHAGWSVWIGFCMLACGVGVAGATFGRAVGREAARRLAAGRDDDGS